MIIIRQIVSHQHLLLQAKTFVSWPLCTSTYFCGFLNRFSLPDLSQDMPRPFKALRELEMEEVAEDIVKALKS